ncbi:unnamed protein product [Miscanthus lutarioriparius]|uniref:F-box domain-containing protein n=1 Tax=Miscanthus lutarioriparius TaxID=422564 RepID=A0A811NUB1_9POAL|nr:unnamed protein product [Miscanthus lutarioriparius]
MASPRTRPSSELDDDTIIDVLLRLPPEEPAHLVRASLVCKQWRRVLSHPDFLRLYARLHRTPPLLGFFTLCSSDSHPGLCFVPIPTTAAGARSPSSSVAAAAGGALAIDHCPWLVLDCLHGRVLPQRRYVADDARAFLVWDPITGDRHELPWLRGGASRAVVIGDQVYLFRLFLGDQILKYDLRRHCLSAIDSPGFYSKDTDVELMTTEDGLLGLAGARRSTLHLWSRTANNAGWEQSRVIDLRTMMISSPAGAGNDDNSSIINGANVIGFAEGVKNAIFVGTNAGTFVIDLKSERARKICDTWIDNPVVPFMTFYSPGMHGT